ncbi:MAG: signal peptidase II [Gammaproteobacteria bacterium]|nr:signal peptidase II [Gammaproteobacteria bacterium]MDP2140360.1 signal peptidase II [Gammaproteobacteria bacterium]MDP2346123.1 signal peptidase II [Gammaproteobacteria bacterium]
MSPSRSSQMLVFSAIALVVVLVSQVGSYLVNSRIPLGSTVEWNSLVHLTHIRNMGGVFGMFQGSGWIFAAFSVCLIAGLVVYLLRGASVQTYEYVCFGFIAGGGISNVLDRLIYGSVIDFINVQHIPYWHYIFNTADVMVHVGLWPMLWFSFFQHDQSRQAI